jgi:hypothetical protein
MPRLRLLSLLLLLFLLHPSQPTRSSTPPLLLLLDALDAAKHSAKNTRLRAETRRLLRELALPPSTVHPLYNCRTPDLFCEKEGDLDHLVPCEETAYMNECLESCRDTLKDCAVTYAAVSSLKPKTTAHNFMRMFLSPKNISVGPDVQSPPPPPPPKPLPQELRKQPPHVEEKKPATENTAALPTDAEDVDVPSNSGSTAPDRKKDPLITPATETPAEVLARARKKDKIEASLARLGIVAESRPRRRT